MQHVPLIDNTSAASIYRPLEQDQIRVLYIHPSDDFNAPIECTLVTQRTDEAAYKALSYVWGDTNVTAWITIDNCLHKITMNLEAGLRHLRDSEGTVALWVDATCINQHDLDERSEQVRRMHEVYSAAEEVVVWLGLADHDSDIAIEFIEHWARKLKGRRLHPSFWEYREGSADISPLELEQSVKEGDFSLARQQNWTALIALMRRPWWRRLWVFQEAVLARDLTYHCGPKALPGQSMCVTTVLLALGSSLLILPGDKISDKMAFHAEVAEVLPVELLHARESFQEGSLIWTPCQLLKHLLEKPCSDPRDRLFIIPGIMGRADIVNVNYHRPLERVCAEFAKDQILYWTPSLAVLSLAGVGRGPPCPGLPSWAPNLLNHPPFGNTIRTIFHAAKDFRAPAAKVSDDFSRLTVTGVVFDTVESLELAEQACRANMLGFELIQQGGVLYPTGCSQFHAVVRTRLQDSYFGNLDGSEVRLQDGSQHDFAMLMFLAFVSLCTWWTAEQHVDHGADAEQPEARQHETSSLLEHGMSLALQRGDLESDLELGSVFPWSNEVHTTAANALHNWPDTPAAYEKASQIPSAWENLVTRQRSAGRRLFRTTKGYFGLGPIGVEPGDLVCVLFGGQTAYLLRERTNKDGYLFVGESYVHGIMDGEVLDDFGINSVDDPQLTKFDIY